MSGKPAPVWVNGVRFDGAGEAADRMSCLLGWEVNRRWVSGIIKRGISTSVNGVTISAFPPGAAPMEPAAPGRPERKAADAAGPAGGPGQDGPEARAASRPLLLRYPPGKAPLDRGVCRAVP